MSGGWRGVWVTPRDLGVDLCEIVLALGGEVGECGVDGGFPCYCICYGRVWGWETHSDLLPDSWDVLE